MTIILSLPPHFYTTLQNTRYVFPHESGDAMTCADLLPYWWDDYLFKEYCSTSEQWLTKRDTDTVKTLVPFFMRCKCLAEHLNFQHAIPAPSFSPRIRDKVTAQLTEAFQAEIGAFQFDLDRIISITQIILYWYLVGKEGIEEICREWRDIVSGVEFPRPALSQLRRMPAYVHQVKDCMNKFQEIRLRSVGYEIIADAE
jgi:hypothetical protein